MRRLLSCSLTLVCFPGLFAYAQEPQVARIGVAVLRTNAKEVSGSQARDQLLKAFARQKTDKNWNVSLQAVALDASQERQALVEAREKNCQFVLSTHLTDLLTSEKFDPSAFQGTGGNVSAFAAKIVYTVRRTSDGAEYAIGSAKSEGAESAGDAIRDAITGLAPGVIANLKKGGNVPRPEAATASADAASGHTVDVAIIGSDFCNWLPAEIPHAPSLRGVCDFAISLPRRMPNFICDQETSRYRGENRVPIDLITALVRYEDGNESYSEVKQNGKPAPQTITDYPGMWSTGEFGNNLRAIFNQHNRPLFSFSGENRLGTHAAWVFAYRIAHQNDPMWRLRTEDQIIAPPYDGELWVDQNTGALLRFRAVAREIPPDFPTQAAELLTDYDDVPFGDGTAFQLPVTATAATRFQGEPQTRNVIQFRNCHKFRARARMVLNVPSGAGESSSASAADSTVDLVKENDIYAILREQAVRDDARYLEAEQRLELEAATEVAHWKIARLEKEREKILNRETPAVKNPVPAIASESVPTYKVSVRLVPVSVVLRDSRGAAVGTFHKEDFRLLDNGKPQAITSFSVEQGNAPTPAAKGENPASQPASPPPPAREPTQVQGERDVALVFDDVHASIGYLAAAGAAATRHIADLRPEDRMAIFTSSGEVAVDFTADQTKLQAAIRDLKPHATVPPWNCPPISPYMADLMVNQGDLDTIGLAIGDTVQCAFAGSGTSFEMQQAQKLAAAKSFEVLNAATFETREALRVLHDVIRRTEAMPGRRMVVLVSPGFLTSTPDFHQDLMELVDRALQAGIVVNALDVRGLLTPGLDASQAHPTDPVLRQRLDREESDLQSGVMFELADGTGGTYFHNNNDMDEGFRRTADAPEYVYVLGFAPQKLDGKFHKLKVTVAKPGGVTVQARQGYYAVKPKAEQ